MPVRPTPDYAAGMWSHCFTPRTAGERRYWLVKSEPDVFSWDALNAAPGRTMHWDGVRNYSARNFMLDGMAVGDRVYFYHSSTDPQAIVGICEVARAAYPDHTQFERAHPAFDADAVADAPTWWMVDLRAVKPLARPVTLGEIKADAVLAQMALVRVGRLSVTPVTPTEWALVLERASKTPAALALTRHAKGAKRSRGTPATAARLSSKHPKPSTPSTRR